jgi:hypothetical protein
MHTNQCVNRWTTTNNYPKIGCPYRYYTCRNRVGHLCHMFTFFFILLYFLLVKYMCKFADRLTHFSMYGSTTAIHKLLYNFQFVLFTYEILLYDLYYGQLFGIVSYKAIFFLQLRYLLIIIDLLFTSPTMTKEWINPHQHRPCSHWLCETCFV